MNKPEKQSQTVMTFDTRNNRFKLYDDIQVAITINLANSMIDDQDVKNIPVFDAYDISNNADKPAAVMYDIQNDLPDTFKKWKYEYTGL